MEEGNNLSSGNHETRKSAHIVCEESKTGRLATNQNYKYNKNDKSIKEAVKNSLSGNSNKKNKQNEVFTEKLGGNKSCKTNSCIAGCKDLGLDPQDQRHSKTKRLPHLLAEEENLKPESSNQHMDEYSLSSHLSGNGASTEESTAGREASDLENPSGDDPSKIIINWPSDSGKSGLDQKPKEHKHKSEDSCEYCSQVF